MLRYPASINLGSLDMPFDQAAPSNWNGTYSKPRRSAEAIDNFLDILPDAWIVEFIVQCATAQFGASERHCNCCHLHTQVQK